MIKVITDGQLLSSADRFEISSKCKTCGDGRIGLWARTIGHEDNVEVTAYCCYCKSHEVVYTGY